jgi:hypothetical protein
MCRAERRNLQQGMNFRPGRTDETRAAAAAGNERAQRDLPRVEAVEARWAKAEAVELRDPAQLTSSASSDAGYVRAIADAYRGPGDDSRPSSCR